jgi:16S rRNA (guanine1207-N2)-methyltransferase
VSPPSPVVRLLTEHLRVEAGEAVVYLHPSSAEAVLAVARNALRSRMVVVHRRLPVVQAIAREAARVGGPAISVVHAHGRTGVPVAMQADVVVIEVPVEKAAAHQLLHEAALLLRAGGRCLLAGGTTDGIKPAVRVLEALFGNARLVAQGGGHRIVEARRAPSVAIEAVQSLIAPYHDADAFRELSCVVNGRPLGVFTRPGVFSWDHLDEASALLAEVMTVPTQGRVLDLGCGAGVLGAAVAMRAPALDVTLVDADSEAVRCASRTMAGTGHTMWRALASDVTSAVAEQRYDLVVSNPPFHTGKATDLELPRRFIAESHAVLRSSGRLQLVANRTLPYEAELERVFGNRRTVHDGARFKVLEAIRR